MNQKFDLKTFKYFDSAAKEGKTKDWFTKNEDLYLTHVKGPMLQLVNNLWVEVNDELPGIEISPKKILRPVKPVHKIIPGENAVKHYINANFSEKENSRFEWNPGIYIQLSSEKDENYVGVGLYMISGRQMKLLREGFTKDHAEIRSILNNKKLKASWGEVQGEKYTRFPKQYQESQPGAEYLWFKQFYFSQHFSRKEVMSADFSRKVVKDLKTIVPFIQWLRSTVGTFKGAGKSNADMLMDW